MAHLNLSRKQRETRRQREQGRGGKGKGWTGNLGLVYANYLYTMDKQQGPTVWHRALYATSWDKP